MGMKFRSTGKFSPFLLIWVCTQLLVKLVPTQPCENKHLWSLSQHDWRTCLKGHRPVYKPPTPCGGESIHVWCFCCTSNNSPLFWDRMAAGCATVMRNVAQRYAPPDPCVRRSQAHVRQEQPPCFARLRVESNLRLQQFWWCRAGCSFGLFRAMRLITC